jgi:hypothetical protein
MGSTWVGSGLTPKYTVTLQIFDKDQHSSLFRIIGRETSAYLSVSWRGDGIADLAGPRPSRRDADVFAFQNRLHH